MTLIGLKENECFSINCVLFATVTLEKRELLPHPFFPQTYHLFQERIAVKYQDFDQTADIVQ